MLRHEMEAKCRGYRLIAGVDEAGRGPLAGPVVAAAAILGDTEPLAGLKDSKQLSPAMREKFFPVIRDTAVGYGIAVVDVETIDAINILRASLLAMKRAVERLPRPPDLLLIDGVHRVDSPTAQRAIVNGDNLSLSIAAASVLAKVTRDRLMDDYHARYPRYEFNRHKGYGTALHRELIRQFGPCPVHRKTFKGVREFLAGDGEQAVGKFPLLP
jgi:ribonuclease HII